MQNRFLYALLITSVLGYAPMLKAQELTLDFMDGDDFVTDTETETPKEASTESITPDITGKQAVDFPARSSMGSLELAPLPGIFETQITGPAPMTPSMSSKDLPSEQLLGRVNPEVFQEMAELERDNTFLKLQIQKEEMKNNLEKMKAAYRKDRLEEIANREQVIRDRITWWQDQERIRLDLEKQRAEAEAAKNPVVEAPEQPAVRVDPEPVEDVGIVPDDIEDVKMGEVAAYTLLAVQGTRGNLMAKIRNTDTNKVSKVRVGDTLSTGDVITSITPTQVVMAFQGTEYVLTFDDGE